MSDYQKEREAASKGLLRFCSVVLLVFFSFIIISCSRSSRPPEEPPRPPKFSFEPPSYETKKLNIVLGIVAPSYDTKVLELPVAVRVEDKVRIKNVIDLFSRSMASDFERMVIARGFHSKGPFKSLDYMTYPDKMGSDLTLTPKIFITTTDGTSRAGGGMFLLASRDSGFLLASHDSCILTVSGFIEMIILEPLSGEKMWIKRIDFEPVSVNCKFSYDYKGDKKKGTQWIDIKVDTRPEALQAALERIYPIAMDTAWRYLHPDEVKRLKQESQEIRERKRY